MHLPYVTSSRRNQWVVVSTINSSMFVAKADLKALFKASDKKFLRFDFVRWIHEDGPMNNEHDIYYGSDHWCWIKKSDIIRVEVVRGEYIKRWDKTLPDCMDTHGLVGVQN